MSSTALVVQGFHQLVYNTGVWNTDTKWRGVPVQKFPSDLWVYQEIIHDLKPDLIIETGTCYGGSGLFMADMCELAGNGRVVSIDLNPRPNRPKHSRLEYFTGSSIDPNILSLMASASRNLKTVLCVLDSDHTCNYVLQEMQAYAQFVTPGSYLIVEDTDVNGNPICPDHGPGPFEAVELFLSANQQFEVDSSREKFMITQNPSGFLRRNI
jgi:cephalosporin hydroxylase